VKITAAQLSVLSSELRARFIRDLEQRLAERTPDLAHTLNEARMHAVVHGAVAAAEAHGLTHRGPIRLAWTRAALAALLEWAGRRHHWPASEWLAEHAVHEMSALHPQKAAHGGEEALRALHAGAVHSCAEYGVDDPRAVMLLTALKFAFGAGCLTDPIYGWIGATLADERVQRPADRFARLERKAITWLQAVVARQSQEA
jgi:hypothetical protein